MRELELFTVPLTGRQLIEASAGTGKTYTITYLYLRLILERQLPVERILVVTYTEAATAELKQRLRLALSQALQAFEGRLAAAADPNLLALVAACPDRRAGVQLLDKALKSFDEAAVFTIHGFCQRMLTELAFESGVLLEAELLADQSALVQDVVDDFVRCHSDLPGWFAERLAGLNCAYLIGLHRQLGPDDELIPAVGRPALEALLESLGPLKAELAAAWRAERAAVSQYLQDDKALNRQTYNAGRVAKLIAGLDDFCAAESLLPFDKFELLTASGCKLKAGASAPDFRLFSLADAYRAAAAPLNQALSDYDIWLKREFASYAAAELARRKEARACLHFDDLLSSMRRAIASPGCVAALRKRFAAALIDEFQDTDPIQYAIFDAIFSGDACLFLIGDPKQAIYAFRGADIFTYLSAKAAVDESSRHTLAVNYRSTAELIAGLNELFGRNAGGFVYADIDYLPVKAGAGIAPIAGEAPLRLWLIEEELNQEEARRRITAAVGREIVRLVDAGLAEPGEIAVLVRSNREARMVRDGLAALKVPCVLETDESVFKSAEAQDLLQVLSAVVQPGRAGLVRAALLTPLVGFTPQAIDELRHDELAAEDLAGGFSELAGLWQRRGFFAMFAEFKQAHGVRERLLGLPLGERRLTNLLQLVELTGSACLEQGLNPEGALKWLGARLAGAVHGEGQELRLESDAKAVRIQTMHKSKGLEYAVVFCPFAWGPSELRKGAEICFHEGGRRLVDLGSPDQAAHAAEAVLEALAENMRLLYVALTRAKRLCYLVYGPVSGFETSAPAWLLHGCGHVPAEAHALLRQLKARPFSELKADILAIDGLRVEALPEPCGSPLERLASGPALSCRSAKRCFDRFSRLSSFSALTAGAQAGEAVDHDQDFGAAAVEDHSIFGFERGARAGTMLHKIFEDLDFTAAPEKRRELVAATLADFGYALDWLDVIDQMVATVLNSELAPGLKLAELPRRACLSELEFFCPIGLLEAPALNAFFAGLPTRLRPAELDFRPVSGQLRGFIDLVFCHDGRYYIVDWKSNHLGDSPADYGRPALEAAMAGHHYTLQYYLYTLALDRYLNYRVPDYCYERHFGGVFYVFLRGVDGSGSGLFAARPEAGEIEALREVLCGRL